MPRGHLAQPCCRPRLRASCTTAGRPPTRPFGRKPVEERPRNAPPRSLGPSGPSRRLAPNASPKQRASDRYASARQPCARRRARRESRCGGRRASATPMSVARTRWPGCWWSRPAVRVKTRRPPRPGGTHPQGDPVTARTPRAAHRKLATSAVGCSLVPATGPVSPGATHRRRGHPRAPRQHRWSGKRRPAATY